MYDFMQQKKKKKKKKKNRNNIIIWVLSLSERNHSAIVAILCCHFFSWLLDQKIMTCEYSEKMKSLQKWQKLRFVYIFNTFMILDI